MLHPSTKRLIDKLSDMTRKQRVTWTEGENGTVVHDTEGYRVVLTPEPHAVLLTDALGREIETCLPEEFADDVDSHGRPYARFIAELYREANRHARGTEKAIRTLLAGLDAVETEPAEVAAAALLGEPDATTDETAPLESETEITAAVATLADQINGAPAAPETAPPLAEEVAPEPDPEPVAELIAAPEPAPMPVPEPEPELEPEPAPEPERLIETAPAPEMPMEAPAGSVEVAPLDEEPGAFGTFGAFQAVEAPPEPAPEPEPAPLPEPVAEAVAPEPAPEPEPALAVPTLSQPISLSSIPFGFGLGAAQRVGAPAPEPKPPVEAELSAPSEPPQRIVIDGTLDLPESMAEDFDDAILAEPYPPQVPLAGPDDLQDEMAPRPADPGAPRRFNPWN
ncbi:hypothetical protein [Hyphomonas sp.]|uniref:hypothetical protein n=1 Tax=Hyphomonas sp. TaxID=87 RepID=UPI00391AD23B